MNDTVVARTAEQLAECFGGLIEMERLALERLRSSELLPGELDGDARLDFLVRLRAAIGKPATGSRDAGLFVETALAQVACEIESLRRSGYWSDLVPTFRAQDFRACARLATDAWGLSTATATVAELDHFQAGQRLVRFVRERAGSLPADSPGREYVILAARTGGTLDDVFGVPVVRAGRSELDSVVLLDAAAIVNLTRAERERQDAREAEARGRREAAEQAEREQREAELAELISKLSDPAVSGRVRQALGV